MNEEELKNIEGPYSWIAKDLEDMQYFAGGQIITDVKRLVAEVRRLSQENEQWRTDHMALKAKLEKAEHEAGWR
jgi:hypothetical protein